MKCTACSYIALPGFELILQTEHQLLCLTYILLNLLAHIMAS